MYEASGPHWSDVPRGVRPPLQHEAERIWELHSVEGATDANIADRMVQARYDRTWAEFAIDYVLDQAYPGRADGNVGGDSAAYERG